MNKLELLRNNNLYSNVIKYDSLYYFDELLLSLMIIKEENNILNTSILFLIKELKTMTGVGLKDTKDFTDIMRYLLLIDTENNISDFIYDINSTNDIIYMIENDINIKYFSRIIKLRKLKTNILKKL